MTSFVIWPYPYFTSRLVGGPARDYETVQNRIQSTTIRQIEAVLGSSYLRLAIYGTQN